MSEDAAPWRDPHWQASAHHWIQTQLDGLGLRCTGTIEQPHVFSWATVMRIPTDDGTLWFKANAPRLTREAALVTLLAARDPGFVPPLLAADPERGWMLMAHAGGTLREAPDERSQQCWLRLLPRYARLQLDLTDDVDELLALGVPDLRLATLPRRYADLFDHVEAEPRFRQALPLVAELCERLAAYGVQETLQHDDLHDGQVFVDGDRVRLLDWGDACVSHPFFSLSVALKGVIARGPDDVEGSVDTAPFRDAYLGPFQDRYDVDLRAACDLALRLGWACRAANGHVPGEDHYTHARLRMFLDRG